VYKYLATDQAMYPTCAQQTIVIWVAAAAATFRETARKRSLNLQLRNHRMESPDAT
jgi:hypothetical protein